MSEAEIDGAGHTFRRHGVAKEKTKKGESQERITLPDLPGSSRTALFHVSLERRADTL
jgi:hypothetical protein